MSTRKYSSELRDAQAEATRDKILDALAEVLASGVDSLSVPAVADRAGVSVGTVYRHFGDKTGLVKALIPHSQRRSGIDIGESPATLEEMDDVVHKLFHHYEKTDDLLRAAFASRPGRAARTGESEERLDLFRKAFRRIDGDLGRTRLEHVAKLGLILTTSDVYLQWKDRLGMNPDEAAAEVMWAIRAALEGHHHE